MPCNAQTHTKNSVSTDLFKISTFFTFKFWPNAVMARDVTTPVERTLIYRSQKYFVLTGNRTGKIK